MIRNEDEFGEKKIIFNLILKELCVLKQGQCFLSFLELELYVFFRNGSSISCTRIQRYQFHWYCIRIQPRSNGVNVCRCYWLKWTNYVHINVKRDLLRTPRRQKKIRNFSGKKPDHCSPGEVVSIFLVRFKVRLTAQNFI